MTNYEYFWLGYKKIQKMFHLYHEDFVIALQNI